MLWVLLLQYKLINSVPVEKYKASIIDDDCSHNLMCNCNQQSNKNYGSSLEWLLEM